MRDNRTVGISPAGTAAYLVNRRASGVSRRPTRLLRSGKGGEEGMVEDDGAEEKNEVSLTPV